MSPRTRKNAETRRDEILEEAIRSLARYGFQEMSFQKIADALKVSQSAILHHFPTKNALVEELVTKIVRHNHELVQASLKPTDDAMTRLKKHFHGNLDWAVRYRDESKVIVVLYHMAGHEPRFTAIYQKVLTGGRHRVVELVAAAMREGYFPKESDPELLGIPLHDMLVGGIIAAICLPPGSAEAPRVKKRWDGVFKRLSSKRAAR